MAINVSVSVGPIKEVQYDDAALMIYGHQHCQNISLYFAARTLEYLARQKSLSQSEATEMVKYHYKQMLFGIGDDPYKAQLACHAALEVAHNLRKAGVR